MTKPYVLTFEPILKEKVWGGRRLEAFGKALPPGLLIGESWEIADLASTSVGGGGGGEARSLVATGSRAGSALHGVMARWGADLLGAAAPSATGGFPLLVKLLDAREHLSVQVHPSRAYAAAHADAHLKTECWYVLDAEPGSVIYKGVKPGVTRDDFERALRAGRGEGVVDLLAAVPAVVGECHNLPSGTVHALGAGVLVAEVQTPSDTTFRVYDWAREYGRTGRGLHVEQALECIDFAPAPPAARSVPGGDCTRLVTTEFYSVEELGHSVRHAIGGACVVSLCATGQATIEVDRQPGVELRAGSVALVPAALSAVVETGPRSGVLLFGLR